MFVLEPAIPLVADRPPAVADGYELGARDTVADTLDCGRGPHDVAIVDEHDSTRRCARVRTG